MAIDFQIRALREQLEFQTRQTNQFAAFADSANTNLIAVLDELRKYDAAYVRRFLGEPEPDAEGVYAAAIDVAPAGSESEA